MGIIYGGPYADLIDANSHEGYPARVMPDGTLTATWGDEFGWDGHIGFRAACDCGWTGPTLHPAGDFDSPGYQAAKREWDTAHLQPLIDKAAGGWGLWAERLAALGAAVAADVTSGRLDYAAKLLDMLAAQVDERRRAVSRLAEEVQS